MDDTVAGQLAAVCSRSALHNEAFLRLRQAFPECKLLRLSFGLQNKVMLSITVELDQHGRTHASYVPIHPTAAAAAVLQNNPVVVVRQDKRSPLWDQEDLYQREGCSALSVVSMPFYWPPRVGAQWDGVPLPVPQNAAFHPTFGALTAAGDEALTQGAMRLLLDLASRTGRHVGAHISMLLSSLEAAELLPSEADAQEELGLDSEDAATEEDTSGEDVFGFEDAQHWVADEAGTDELLPGLGPTPAQSSPGIPCCPQQKPHAPQQPWTGATTGHGAGAEEEDAEDRDGLSTPTDAPGPSSSALPNGQAQPGASLGGGHQQQVQQQQVQQQQQHSSPAATRSRAGGQPPAAPRPSRLTPLSSAGGRPLEGRQRQQQGQGQGQAQQAPQAGSSSQQPQRMVAATPSVQHPAAPGRAAASRVQLAAAGGPHAAANVTRSSNTSRAAPLSGQGTGRTAARLAAASSAQAGGSGSVGGGGSRQGSSEHSSGMLSVHCPWRNMSFQPEGLEQAFVAHHGRLHERTDLAALLLLALGLLGAAASRASATWPAGVAAMLLFTPYFLDSRVYQNMRGRLLPAVLVLASVFLASLSLTSPALAPATANPSKLAGFGICWFMLHNCGLHFLLAAPMLLRLPMSQALPVHATSLVMALYRLPNAYTAALGPLDTVHVLLLAILLTLGALAALMVCQALEQQQRDEWLVRRVRRGEGMPAALQCS
ncbi:hypothetical protein D9Q98_009000 [Chlorella vulgaris]|uniref:Uncharacterized protein n=1 Tax=Chlorella vulgaris TaxID=3077 RepID=A0A9D4TH00_CHLVU|nr:hypothetical protein D9Q98_009000 [Chlorella vulgaris]